MAQEGISHKKSPDGDIIYIKRINIYMINYYHYLKIFKIGM